MKKGDYIIVRTYSAGVFAGTLKQRQGQEVELKDARRIWYWDGAASLSQMAQEGVSKPGNCKFTVPTDVIVTQAIELLPVTAKAKKNILAVPAWRQ